MECEIPQRARTWAVRKRPGQLMSMTGGRGFTWDERLAGLVLLVDGVARVRRIRVAKDIVLLLSK